MSRKTNEKLFIITVILMIIAILSVDFFLLGSNLISYATNMFENTTGENNIKFTAYFKNEKNEEYFTITRSIKSDNLKLYAKVQVEKEGYLEDGIIEIKNQNFNVKSDILSPEISEIEGNKIKLKQINAGETVEVEIGLEPIITDKVPANMVLTEAVELTGIYVSSENEEGEEIEPAIRAVSVNYQVEENAMAELRMETITNKVFTESETTKTVVQQLVKSRLRDNQYPVEQTTIEMNIPAIGEKEPTVKVIAANGRTQISNYTIENGKLRIIISNEKDSAGYVNWYKNGYDEIIITFMYEGAVETTYTTISASSEIKVYNSENTCNAGAVLKLMSNNTDNTTIAKQEINTTEMYKGELYANIPMTYNTTTTLVVTDVELVNEITINEGLDKFVLKDVTTIDTDAKYVKTEINKQQLLELLGTNGTITIKSGDTTLLETTIVSQVNEENIIVNYTNPVGQLEIITTTPEKEGTIEIKHTKTMTSNGYSREQIRTIEKLKTMSSINGTSSVENPTEAEVTLNETISKAELTIENRKSNLSTVEPNELIMGVTLVTDEVKYDLYKNPVITIQLPSDVENVEFLSEPSKINANGFEKIYQEYDNVNKVIKITIDGEQTTYAQSAATQTYIQLNVKVTLSPLVASHTDLIKMTYLNENAIQYYNEGKFEKEITISAPSKVLTMFNLSSNENHSLTELLLQKIDGTNKGKKLDFEMVVINNKDTDIENVKIIGKLPTVGNVLIGEDGNTLETTLKNVNAPNATVFYTENINATTDTEDVTNGWTTELSTIANAKLYLIKMNKLEKGAKYNATMSVGIPNTIESNTASYTQYEVIYDTQTQTEAKETSRKIGLMTSMAATIKTEIKAHVGQDELKEGDIVKEGEVIKYTITVKNNGTKTLKNVLVNLDVPEGTVFVRPIPRQYDAEGNVIEGSGYVYAENAYYEEITDAEKLRKVTNITISSLSTSEPYILEYEVRINKGSAGKEISNNSKVTYDGTTIELAEIKNIIKEANIRVTIKRTIDEANELLSGGTSRYKVYVENLSDSKINNLEMKILANGFNILEISKIFEESEQENQEENLESIENINEPISIDGIEPKKVIAYSINGEIDNEITEMNIWAIVNDNTGNKYRSNKLTTMLPITRTTVNLTTPQNGKYIKEGDIVNYKIKVTYEGNITRNVSMRDDISEYLQVQSISINGEEVIQCLDSTKTETYIESISNNVYRLFELEPGKSAEIDIKTKVGYIPELYHGNVITNYVTTEVGEILSNSSQVVTHILKSNLNENVENIISGFAWFDKNGNGKKDKDENILPEIKVKLFDISTNSYLIDSFGGIIETKTNNNGEYTFTKVKNGSYLIIFEYDVSQNEPTLCFATGADDSLNSKAILKTVEINGQKKIVSAIEVNNLKNNIFYMNIGLKEGCVNTNPEQPNDPNQPDNPNNPNNPDNPDNPTDSSKNKYTISGLSWLDLNRNGQKDENENNLSNIKVRIYNPETNKFVTQENGKTLEMQTDSNGKYEFSNIPKGTYILVFEYDTEKYIPTLYMANGVANNLNSKVILKNINIDGKNISAAVTDLISLQNNVTNINIGLKENLIFDLELQKYISKIIVQNNKGTKAYNYENSTFEKVEIHRKQIQNSLVVLEYKIRVKNTGEIAGYARNIVDYLPEGMTFSSELNTEWYLLGDNLYTKNLENIQLNPGEEKEIKLILTKTMTNENTGLINNRAEIYEAYNKYGDLDKDSTPNNKIQGEDDFGVADVIIAVSTGGSVTLYIILLIINIILISIVIRVMIKNEIIKISNKRARG